MKLSELKIKTPAELLELAQSLVLRIFLEQKNKLSSLQFLNIRLTMKRRFWEMVF
jgi:hypothetical protein